MKWTVEHEKVRDEFTTEIRNAKDSVFQAIRRDLELQTDSSKVGIGSFLQRSTVESDVTPKITSTERNISIVVLVRPMTQSPKTIGV